MEGAAVGGGEARACRREPYCVFTSVCEISNQYHGILLDGKHCDMSSHYSRVRKLEDLSMTNTLISYDLMV